MARCRELLLGLAVFAVCSGNLLAQASFTLAPQTTLAWTIESPDPLYLASSGESDVGLDGSILLGSYGSVQVAGLSLEQARRNLEQYLAQHMPQPRVTLRVASARPIQIAFTRKPAPTPLQPTSYQTMEPEPQPAAPPVPLTAETNVAVEEAAEPPLQGGSLGQQTWQGVDRDDAGSASSEWRPVSRVVHRPSHIHRVSQGQPAPIDELKIQPRQLHSGHGGHSGPDIVYNAPVPAPVPNEHAKITLPPYVIEPPDILLVESTQQLRDQPIRGQHLVRPDGTIGLGIYGSVYVAGMTLEQAKDAVAQQVGLRVKDVDARNIVVDVLAYNSKFYYVITDGGGYGESVTRVPITGNETVLDAIGQINGLPAVASKKNIWVARANQGGHQTLPVDWIGITQHGATATNYQVMPGDRVYVKAQKIIRVDSALAKVVSPIERILGITLLGSTTVNSLKNRGNNFGN